MHGLPHPHLFGYCGSDDCPELACPVCLTGCSLLPMRRREPFKIARGEIQRGRARVKRLQDPVEPLGVALHPTRQSPAEVEALIADYEDGAAL